MPGSITALVLTISGSAILLAALVARACGRRSNAAGAVPLHEGRRAEGTDEHPDVTPWCGATRGPCTATAGVRTEANARARGFERSPAVLTIETNRCAQRPHDIPPRLWRTARRRTRSGREDRRGREGVAPHPIRVRNPYTVTAYDPQAGDPIAWMVGRAVARWAREAGTERRPARDRGRDGRSPARARRPAKATTDVSWRGYARGTAARAVSSLAPKRPATRVVEIMRRLRATGGEAWAGHSCEPSPRPPRLRRARGLRCGRRGRRLRAG